MILVTGITGRIGSSLARSLLESGQEVGGLVRDPRQIGQLPPGITGFVGDFEDPDTTREAMDAADSLYLPCGIDAVEELYQVVRSSGVRHVVQLSGVAAVKGNAQQFMVIAEQTAKASGIAYTFLRPSAFMSNALRWADQVRAGGPIRILDSLAEAIIDPYDIGRVAASILSAPDDHGGEAYPLTGSQLLRESDCVRMVGEAIGRDLEFVAITEEEALEQMRSRFGPQVPTTFLKYYTDETHHDREPNDYVQRLTGTPPRTFDVWVRENLSAFIG